jgi:hypothetical protein
MSLVNQCPAARSLARSRSRYLEVIRPVAYLARIRPFPSPRAWPDLLGAVNYRLRPCFYADGGNAGVVVPAVFLPRQFSKGQVGGSPCREHHNTPTNISDR